MNTRIAEAAEAAAVFLAEHNGLPEVAQAEITHSRSADTVAASFQVAASLNELAALVDCAQELDEPTITVTRHESPTAYVAVKAEGSAAGVPVMFWTHLRTVEASALWQAVGHEPEAKIAARISLDSLRSAAKSISDTSEGAA